MSTDIEKEYKHLWYLKNKDRIKEQKREYNRTHKEQNNESKRKYKLRNKEKLKEDNKQYYLRNKTRILERSHKYMKNNRLAATERTRKYRLNHPQSTQEAQRRKVLKQYGITEDEYDIILFEQEDKCAICGKHKNDFEQSLCIDHIHETGEIRGLLCKQCNLGLGNFKDNVEVLQSAIKYCNSTSWREKEQAMSNVIQEIDLIDTVNSMHHKNKKLQAVLLQKVEEFIPKDSPDYLELRKVILDETSGAFRGILRDLFGDVEMLV